MRESTLEHALEAFRHLTNEEKDRLLITLAIMNDVQDKNEINRSCLKEVSEVIERLNDKTTDGEIDD